jgi:hypothetical protein
MTITRYDDPKRESYGISQNLEGISTGTVYYAVNVGMDLFYPLEPESIGVSDWITSEPETFDTVTIIVDSAGSLEPESIGVSDWITAYYTHFDFMEYPSSSTQDLLIDTEIDEVEDDLETLKRIYTFQSGPEVVKFLNAEANLVPLLKEAYDEIRKYFPSAVLILDILIDPEATDEKELAILIRTSLHPDEALDRLDLLDEEWWLDASLDTGEKLSIHLEFE